LVLAISLQNRLPAAFPNALQAKNFRFCPFKEIGKPVGTETRKESWAFSRTIESVFRSDDGMLLGLIAAFPCVAHGDSFPSEVLAMQAEKIHGFANPFMRIHSPRGFW
jgi:hypothetical protein